MRRNLLVKGEGAPIGKKTSLCQGAKEPGVDQSPSLIVSVDASSCLACTKVTINSVCVSFPVYLLS